MYVITAKYVSNYLRITAHILSTIKAIIHWFGWPPALEGHFMKSSFYVIS